MSFRLTLKVKIRRGGFLMRVKRIFGHAAGQADSALSSEKKDCSFNLGLANPNTVLPTLARDGFVIRWYRRKVMDS